MVRGSVSEGNAVLASLGSGTGILDSCRTLTHVLVMTSPHRLMRGLWTLQPNRGPRAEGLDTNEPQYLPSPPHLHYDRLQSTYISHAGMALQSCSQALHKEGASGTILRGRLTLPPRPRPYQADSSSRPSSSLLHSHIRPILLLTRHAPFFTQAGTGDW